ncbi:MAG: hypothetical protein IKG46_10515 [Solobacterium sp.]|nr:hypothetical protein [Solobacterium sp.]
MKNTANKAVRERLQKHHIAYWKLAQRLDCTDMTVYRMLRTELPEAKQNELIKLIEQIAQED